MTKLESIVFFVCVMTSWSHKMDPFITGGSLAKIEQFPHSVYLYMNCVSPQACGGSVLTQNVVLTAAHCFEQCLRNWDIMAFAGDADINEMQTADRVQNFIMHRNYNSKLVTNDIALGYIKSNWPLGRTIKRVMIARNFQDVKLAKIAGWGVNEVTWEAASKLKMVSQIVQPKVTCQEAVRFQPGMMCAVNNVKNYPSHGDSGCALVAGSGQQIGLVSFRSPKRVELVIYTNVSYYYDWITSYASQLHCASKT